MIFSCITSVTFIIFLRFLKPAGFTLIKDFDVAGRGMNAAFAIGRLCDMEVGRKRLLLLSDSEKMVCHYIVFVKSLEIRRICNFFLFQVFKQIINKIINVENTIICK